jgi:DNA helicase HerA-like ATPase
VGEALVSLLDEKGRPTVVERAFVVPPGTRIGPITPEERATIIKSSVLRGVYDQVEDRESAYEKLTQRVAQTAASGKPLGTIGTAGGQQQPAAAGGGILGTLGTILGGSTGPRGGRREGMIEAAAKSAARSIGSQIGRDIVRGVLGSILGGGRRR